MDKALIPSGLPRASMSKFLLWILPWVGLGLFGVYSIFLCLRYALNMTGMDNRYAFGIWIVFDLIVIGLGAGAFFLGFLTYILRRKKLRPIMNSAVVVGFICYSGALTTLAIDVGQPIRAWFPFWHANIHSMLTEVVFCITCYLMVLLIEYVPLLLKNRQLKSIPGLLVFEYDLHKIMAVFAGIGTFLSFFHQGSLGGMFGVMYGRTFAFREHFFIWPTTFFLFILSAIAVGPSFMSIIAMTVQKITSKKLIRLETFTELGLISGILLSCYFIAKLLDTARWWFTTVPGLDAVPAWFYANQPFGIWVLVVELFVFGLVPPIIFLGKKRRQSMSWLALGSIFACVGIAFNRFIVTIQAQTVPTLTFDEFYTYAPTWQEWGVIGAVVAYGVLLYSLSYRFLPLFPQERELALQQRRRG
ncbi:MAG: polysulfide reductase NrfD [Deltaproteobacteria bacterium]|nr:polysulfide reductase NrfD [Deltaproteobacteria bacterium]